MKKYHYQVVNANGSIVAIFDQYRSAVSFRDRSEGVGMMYGLRLRRYKVNV